MMGVATKTEGYVTPIITGRRIRSGSKLEPLPAEQREQLHFWCEESCVYYEIVRLIREVSGISASRKTLRDKGRSKGPEVTNLPGGLQNSPRFPGYFKVLQAKAVVESEPTKHAKRLETVGELEKAIGRCEGPEAAAKAQSCEGRSKGSEAASSLGKDCGETVLADYAAPEALARERRAA